MEHKRSMRKSIFILPILIFAFAVNINAQALISIAEIQGEKFRSEYADKLVKTQGIVTGIRKSGFFIQTPDDKIDDNPKTSEGIWVYTQEEPDSKIKIGDLVEVSGKISEFRQAKEVTSLFLTEFYKPETKILSSDNPLPKPIVLTEELLNSKVPLDFMERFEGMRVQVNEFTVTAPTGGYENRKEGKFVSDGVFYGVVGNTPRPMREPGIDALTVLFKKLPQTLPIFDMNPELLRVDSDGMNGGEAIDVTAGAKIKNLVGFVDYYERSYTLLVDFSVKPTVENLMKPVIASPAGEREVTVASFNLHNFFDDETNSKIAGKETKLSSEQFERKLKKTSLAIRTVLSMPDVLGVIEVENLIALKKLAKQLNEDAVAAKLPNPQYEAYLEDGNDFRGIDVGYLIKSSKVKVIKVEQLFKDVKLDHKDANPNEHLFDRPPMLMQLEVADAKKGDKLAFTVIINHFKSFLGVEDDKDGDRVQNKRRMEAELLAKFLVDRQKENPNELMVVMGDFNAFQFADGYNDLMGALKGRPEKNVVTPSKDVFNTGLINIVETNSIRPENRYSYIYDGNAQVLDHILINKPIIDYAKKFGYARFNADFPIVYENDVNRPERVSDHDAPVLFLSMDKREEKKEEPKNPTEKQ